MDAISVLIRRTEILVDIELNELVNKFPDDTEIADNIRITLAAQTAGIKLMIEDKLRLNQIAINPDNRLCWTGNAVLCALTGKTRRREAKFSIAWGNKHVLNTTANSPLSNKTNENTVLLGLVALINQIILLQLKKVIILTTHSSAALSYNSLENAKAAGYADMNREKLKDANILQMLYELKSKHDIKIEIRVHLPSEPAMGEPFDRLLNTAKSQLDEALA